MPSLGVDPQVYESGNLTAHLSISKRGTAIGRKVLYLAINQIQSAKKVGNPCHIADYYEKRKRSSETASHKKAAIASIHKLLRTIFALIKKDQLYSYDVAKHNQKTFVIKIDPIDIITASFLKLQKVAVFIMP
jgi:transposase